MQTGFPFAPRAFDRQLWSQFINQFCKRLATQARALAQRVPRWTDITRSVLRIGQHISRRAKIHHVYFALALFDLAAVGTGLYLNHHLNQTLANSTGINASLNRRFTEVDAFRQSVNAVVAIGHNVSYGKSAENSLAPYRDAASAAGAKLSAFLPSLLQFARRYEPVLRPASGAYEALAHTLVVDAIGQIAIQRTGVVLNLYARGDVTEAAALSREMSGFHNRFLMETDTLSKMLRNAESELQNRQLAEGHDLQRLEYLIGLMMIFMVCAVTLYGHKLGKIFQMKHDELEIAHHAAKNAEAETRVLNEDVTKLNVQLLESIHKLKEAQDEIVKKGKLAQLGQLTATVAHEIRNPLGAVKTAAYLVERKTKDKGLGLEPQLQRISNGVTRCDNIITELLDFARTKSLALKTMAVDQWVRATVEEEAKSLPAKVQVSCDLDLGDTTAAFDADCMRRVMINLISNAAEAMVGKGNHAAATVTEKPRITVTTRRVADAIEITVTDNGPGISPENIKKILEPLFTTKSFGVGLGLPAVEKILEQHGGGLRITSNPGNGAMFTAWLPFAQSDRRVA